MGSGLLACAGAPYLVSKGKSPNWDGEYGKFKVYSTFSEPISNPSEDLYITWVTNSPDSKQLEYRKAASNRWTSTTSVRSRPMPGLVNVYLHTAAIEGLEPDTVYEYTPVGMQQSDFVKTLPSTAPIRLCLASDYELRSPEAYTESESLWRMGDVVNRQEMDLLIWNGDMVNDDGRIDEEWSGRWMDFLRVLSSRWRRPDAVQIPWVAILGNHEARRPSGRGAPASGGNGISGQISEIFTFGFWSEHPNREGESVAHLRIGDELLLMILNTDHTLPMASQRDWFARILSENASKVRHALIAGHAPPFNTLRFSSTDFHTTSQSREMRNHFWPVAQQYDSVRAWLGGHIHTVMMSHKLRFDYDPKLSLEENDRRWLAQEDGFRQIGCGPIGITEWPILESLDMTSSLDGSPWVKSFLARAEPPPLELVIRGEVFNTDWITIPGREISNVWNITLAKDYIHYQSINRNGDVFMQQRDNI
jgi:hypothetical protein